MEALLVALGVGAGTGIGLFLGRPRAVTPTCDPYTFNYTPDFSVTLPEPWRDHRLAEECGNLPTQVVAYAAHDDQVAWTRNSDAAALDRLREQIAVNGITHPLVLDVCNDSIFLRDGYHRLLCALDLGIERVPVYVRRVNGIKVRPRHADEFLVQVARCVDWGIPEPKPRETE